MIDLKQRLSEHFTLGEMLRTNHRAIQNTPTEENIRFLEMLCQGFLEPLRIKFGPLYITSGLRVRALNEAIGGAKDSAHIFGCAADLVPLTKPLDVEDLWDWVAYESDLPFDQVIDERSSTSSWLHLGMLRPGFEKTPRRECLTFRDGQYVLIKKG